MLVSITKKIQILNTGSTVQYTKCKKIVKIFIQMNESFKKKNVSKNYLAGVVHVHVKMETNKKYC
jgi:hypothetical protein